jgi:hypothetical protein
MFTEFYHGLIRKTVIAFGTMFNQIYVNRDDGSGNKQRIKVPLTYSTKEKFINRLSTSLSDLNNQSTQITLPRMSFAISSILYDAERKKNSIHRRYKETVATSGDVEFSYHHSTVPYNIDFTLSCYVRNMDDGLQIVEQILPFFTPEFTITIKPGVLSDSAEKLDIPLVLNQVSTEEAVEGALLTENTRFIVWDLTFTAKTNIYGPVKSHKLIKQVEASIFGFDDNQI